MIDSKILLILWVDILSDVRVIVSSEADSIQLGIHS